MHRYRFTDHSVLRPWLTRVWFARLFPLLPRWMAANFVTLVSTGTLSVILVASFFAERLAPATFALIQFVALQVYVAGDHLDGMQAKASGTQSPLGDFLDHHCDLWAGCVLCFGYWSLSGTAPLWSLYATTVILASSFAITFVERAEQKALHFTAWGTLEVIAILSVFFLSWAVAPIRSWWLGDLWNGVPRYFIVSVTASAMAIGAMIVIARRLQRIPWPFIISLSTLVALASWLSTADVAPLWGWVTIALTAADYVALVMHAYTTERPRPWPDFVPPATVAVLWFTPAAMASGVLAALTVWLIVRYVATLGRILSRWRTQWALIQTQVPHDAPAR